MAHPILVVFWQTHEYDLLLYTWIEWRTGYEVIKLFFMPNSTEHEISTAHKN